MTVKKALLVIDVQNDFCPGGSLAVAEGDRVVKVINSISKKYGNVVATKDWHPEDHVSFARSHEGKKEFGTIELPGGVQALWPPHCVQGTKGAEFHPDLDTRPFQLVLHKGTDPRLDSYSAFRENDRKTMTGLAGYLRELGVNEVHVCGLATDYCVFFTAMDAVSERFEVKVIIDACRGVDFPRGNVEKSVAEMRKAGIKIVESKNL